MTETYAVPAGYESLESSCRSFRADHPDYDRNVFIMSRQPAGDRTLERLDRELRRVIRLHGCEPLYADDKCYPIDRSLWDNTCVYMIGCKYGIAVLEDRIRDEFNPNVALEYGFMRALNKPVLMLADRGFRNLRADVIGTLYAQFDIADIAGSIRAPVERWFADIAVGKRIVLPHDAPAHARAAPACLERLPKIEHAKDKKEMDDELWYLGEELEKYRQLIARTPAGSAHLLAIRKAQRLVNDHDRTLIPELTENLMELLVG